MMHHIIQKERTNIMEIRILLMKKFLSITKQGVFPHLVDLILHEEYEKVRYPAYMEPLQFQSPHLAIFNAMIAYNINKFMDEKQKEYFIDNQLGCYGIHMVDQNIEVTLTSERDSCTFWIFYTRDNTNIGCIITLCSDGNYIMNIADNDEWTTELKMNNLKESEFTQEKYFTIYNCMLFLWKLLKQRRWQNQDFVDGYKYAMLYNNHTIDKLIKN